MYIGVMIVLEGYRDGGIVEGVGVDVLYSAAFGFHSTKVKNIIYIYIRNALCFSFEHHDYNSKNILYYHIFYQK